MVSYDHKLFQLRIPTEEYERLTKLRTQRVIEAIHKTGNHSNISMHEILLEALKKLEK